MSKDNFVFKDLAEDESVVISTVAYERLLESEAFLHALEAAGVDNWEGYDDARAIYNGFNE